MWCDIPIFSLSITAWYTHPHIPTSIPFFLINFSTTRPQCPSIPCSPSSSSRLLMLYLLKLLQFYWRRRHTSGYCLWFRWKVLFDCSFRKRNRMKSEVKTNYSTSRRNSGRPIGKRMRRGWGGESSSRRRGGLENRCKRRRGRWILERRWWEWRGGEANYQVGKLVLLTKYSSTY